VTTPFSSMVWVVVGSFIGSLGAVGLKAGSRTLQMNIVSLVTNWRLAAGITGYLISAVFFIQGVRHGELSVLYPMVSLGYLWTMVWSKLFFDEPITRGKLIAVFLILCGCGLIGLGNR
jgi:drug/metabolite transporter (DMT)-like permease